MGTRLLRRAWWNKLPGWVQPMGCVVLMLAGWWFGDAVGIIIIVWGAIGFVVGLMEWSGRRAARQVLEAAHRNAAQPTIV